MARDSSTRIHYISYHSFRANVSSPRNSTFSIISRPIVGAHQDFVHECRKPSNFALVDLAALPAQYSKSFTSASISGINSSTDTSGTLKHYHATLYAHQLAQYLKSAAVKLVKKHATSIFHPHLPSAYSFPTMPRPQVILGVADFPQAITFVPRPTVQDPGILIYRRHAHLNQRPAKWSKYVNRPRFPVVIECNTSFLWYIQMGMHEVGFAEATSNHVVGDSGLCKY